jgi:hypothetical protein
MHRDNFTLRRDLLIDNIFIQVMPVLPKVEDNFT